MRLRERRDGPRLLAQPRPMGSRPRRLSARKAAAVTQEKLRQPMTRPQQIRLNVLATTQQIPRGFFLVRRNVDRRQRASAIQDRQVTGIATIGLDAIAGTTWNQGG